MNIYTIQKGDTFKGEVVTEVKLQDNKVVFTTEPKREDWEMEIIKCKESPYYFATTYLTVNGKPFNTPLNETQFNNYFNK